MGTNSELTDVTGSASLKRLGVLFRYPIIYTFPLKKMYPNCKLCALQCGSHIQYLTSMGHLTSTVYRKVNRMGFTSLIFRITNK